MIKSGRLTLAGY